MNQMLRKIKRKIYRRLQKYKIFQRYYICRNVTDEKRIIYRGKSKVMQLCEMLDAIQIDVLKDNKVIKCSDFDGFMTLYFKKLAKHIDSIKRNLMEIDQEGSIV